MEKTSPLFHRLCAALVLIVAALSLACMAGCAAGSSLEGSWANEKGDEVLIFENDGTCSVPFTYSGSWLESCDRYVVQDDDTIVLSSSEGNIKSRSYKKVGSEEEALDRSESRYYLSGNTLVINHTKYTKL